MAREVFMEAKDKLDVLLRQQEELRGKLADSEAAARELTVELASGSAADLMKAGDRFMKQFVSGPFLKSFNDLLSCLEALEGYDGKYQGQFATSEPYGMPLSPEQRYFCQYLLGGPLRADGTLVAVLTRITDNRSVPGNPFSKEGK
jgi:hypothetical protein